jgi:serine/threonine-protein kinase
MIGTVLTDRYEILELIGEGGMGVVYKAKHVLMNRIVAIKMLLEDYAAKPEAMKRFEQEIKAVSSLNHPNILGVYDYGTSEKGQPFLVTEFLQGKSLEAFLNEKGKLSLEQAVPIFIQTCTGLAHAHQKGVVHRDLKPSNLMLIDYEGQNSFVKVLDFGIAKVISGDGALNDLTKSGEIFGSPLYMSPEQCRAQPLDARSDVYSLGCVMYKCLTGMPPIQGDDLLEVLFKQVNQDPKHFEEVLLNQNYYAEMEKVVFKAMAKELPDRYQNMNELRKAILVAVGQGEHALSISLDSIPFAAPTLVRPDSVGENKITHSSIKLKVDDYQAGEKSYAPFSTHKLENTAEIPAAATNPTSPPTETSKYSKPLIAVSACLVLVLIAGAFYIFKPDAVQPLRFNRSLNRANQQFTLGRYKEALVDATEAQRIAYIENNPKRLYETLPVLAKIYQGLGAIADAKAANLEIVSKEIAAGHTDSLERAEAYERLSDLYANTGTLQEAKRTATLASEIRERHNGGPDKLQQFQSLIRIAEIELYQGQVEEATKIFDDLEKIRLKHEDKLPDGGARLLRDEASLAVAKGHLSDAEVLSQKAITVMTSKFGADNPRVSSFYCEQAEVLIEEKKYGEAKDLLETGIRNLEHTVGDKNLLLIPLYFNLARLHVETKDFDHADVLCRRILNIGEPVLAESDGRLRRTRALYQTVLSNLDKTPK